MRLMADDVVIDLSGMLFKGKQGFKKFWNLNNSQNSEVWDWMWDLIKVGASEKDNSLIWPYINKGLTGYRVALGADVPIHAAPDTSSPVLQLVDHEQLKFADDAMNGFQEMMGWSAVTTSSGTYGFVSHDKSIDPSNDRMIFVKKDSQWKLVACEVREY